MTDLTHTAEKVFRCPACGAMVPASGQDLHKKKHNEDNAFRNRVNQFLQKFGNNHLEELFEKLNARFDGLDGDVRRIDTDYTSAFEAINKLEEKADQPATPPTGTGVQVAAWDDPDLTDPPADDADEDTLPNPATAPVADAHTYYAPGTVTP